MQKFHFLFVQWIPNDTKNLWRHFDGTSMRYWEFGSYPIFSFRNVAQRPKGDETSGLETELPQVPCGILSRQWRIPHKLAKVILAICDSWVAPRITSRLLKSGFGQRQISSLTTRSESSARLPPDIDGWMGTGAFYWTTRTTRH